MLDGKDRQRFLLAIISLTIAADQSREVAVELEDLKAAVLERIVVSSTGWCGEREGEEMLSRDTRKEGRGGAG